MSAPQPGSVSGSRDTSFDRLRRIFRFLVTGGAGFIADAGVLWLMMTFTPAGPILARCVSFPAALTVTWILNRSWSFGDRERPHLSAELIGYVTIQVIGFLVNSGIYVVLVLGWLGFSLPALVALFFGSGTSAFVTFALLNMRLYRAAD